MSRETALQQERACASFDCADSTSATSTSRQRQRKSIFQRCVLILLVPSLLLGPAHAAPTAVVEPAANSMHALATTIGLSVGNPILPATAEKFQSETDFADAGPAPLSFGRYYRSTWGADTSRPAGVLGAAWTHTHGASLRATPAVNPVGVTITSAEGYVRTFTLPAGASAWSATNSADSLTWTPVAWIYRRADDDSTSHFDATGKLLSRTARNGWTTRYAYDAAARISTITGPYPCWRSRPAALGIRAGTIPSETCSTRTCPVRAVGQAGHPSILRNPAPLAVRDCKLGAMTAGLTSSKMKRI
jgi:YD repeat-containing protein